MFALSSSSSSKPSDPDLSHLTTSDYDDVYEPAEDTYLMMDALWKDVEYLRNVGKNHLPLCLEIGTGSGTLITYLSSLLQHSCICYATDINPKACMAAWKTMIRNGCYGDIVNCDLVTPLLTRLYGHVDIILFNPPYVVTEASEMEGDGIQRAWAGGARGREVLDRLLPHIPSLLSRSGVLYLVILSPANDPTEIASILSQYGFTATMIIERRAGIEHLQIWKYQRKQIENIEMKHLYQHTTSTSTSTMIK